ncbi:hypothetical protein [Sinorhizobium meliloti]|uniref:hypothetical protein n=1 Tax=Rhizobium meliloti TaxID=382 RepID=UPI000FDA484E|nr:hypothetical protein [Sinorhizobium meliloti]MDW9762164.1 hypothetical protein [Sinorhizobium meliloti]RVQ21811.1 hypothetical protein CN067_11815 [Sinorhizobium meliloti]RVQ55739.1 hypothetical protein CN060_21045 [Sinorhizobium meliloti]
MSEMVDRVAQAIIGNPPVETIEERVEGTFLHRDYERTARAAIEAMKEPTLEMKMAGALKFMEVSLGNGSTKVRTPALGEDHLSSYARMIQAALKEKA